MAEEEFEDTDREDEEELNQEGVIFARILRHIAAQLGEQNSALPQEELETMGGLCMEMADAFEQAGGFEYQFEQALPLSQTFAMLDPAILGLATMANEMGQHNAAAKMEWAANLCRNWAQDLEDKHHCQADGIISFALLDDEEE